MKRKILVLVSLVLVLTFVLCACVTEDTYSNINKLLKIQYSKVELTVSTTLNGETLTSTVTSTLDGDRTTIDYKLQQFATFGDNVPDSFIEEKIGQLVVRNGEIISHNGDQAVLEIEQVTAKFRFESSYFSSAQVSGKKFTGVVSNAQDFFGDADFVGDGVKVIVVFDEVIESLQVDYTSANGAQVKLIYTFTK